VLLCVGISQLKLNKLFKFGLFNNFTINGEKVMLNVQLSFPTNCKTAPKVNISTSVDNILEPSGSRTIYDPNLLRLLLII
jgi:hypothetical protein